MKGLVAASLFLLLCGCARVSSLGTGIVGTSSSTAEAKQQMSYRFNTEQTVPVTPAPEPRAQVTRRRATHGAAPAHRKARRAAPRRAPALRGVAPAGTSAPTGQLQ